MKVWTFITKFNAKYLGRSSTAHSISVEVVNSWVYSPVTGNSPLLPALHAKDSVEQQSPL